MSNQEDGQNSRLPQHILDQISKFLKDDTEKLLTVMIFLCNQESEKTKRYLQVFRCVFNNEQAFKGIVDKLAEDIEKSKNDPNYLDIMADIWSNYLKPNEKKDVGDGQRFDFQSVLSNMTLMKSTTAYNFISTLSMLDLTLQNEVVQLMVKVAEATRSDKLVLSINQGFKNFLQATRSTAGKLAVSVSMVAISNNLKQWWNGEISGKRCAKTIIDNFAGFAAAIGGGIAGAAVGTSTATGIGIAIGFAVAPRVFAIGTILGGIVGGVASAKVTTNLSDWATQKIFNLPKDTALENAYTFLGLKNGASNDEINLKFRSLARKYHPDKDGNYDDWHKLQVSMGIIKHSKGEIETVVHVL